LILDKLCLSIFRLTMQSQWCSNITNNFDEEYAFGTWFLWKCCYFIN